jgi:putative transcriptional regulator
MNKSSYLTNQFVIAMPMLTDPYFIQGVVYICEHTENGAVGIVINHPLNLNVTDVFKQMEIKVTETLANDFPVLCGGPTHPERGFVIHTPRGNWRSTLEMNSEISVTTSRDILQAIAENQGPSEVIVTLGYASWTAGQLEQEILDNYWLTSPIDLNVLFKTSYAKRWHAAMHNLGIDPVKLSTDVGHA